MNTTHPPPKKKHQCKGTHIHIHTSRTVTEVRRLRDLRDFHGIYNFEFCHFLVFKKRNSCERLPRLRSSNLSRPVVPLITLNGPRQLLCARPQKVAKYFLMNKGNLCKICAAFFVRNFRKNAGSAVNVLINSLLKIL